MTLIQSGGILNTFSGFSLVWHGFWLLFAAFLRALVSNRMSLISNISDLFLSYELESITNNILKFLVPMINCYMKGLFGMFAYRYTPTGNRRRIF